MDKLNIYKMLKSNKDMKGLNVYELGCALIGFTSIENYIENPTDEEYNVIFHKCYEAYMKAEESNLSRLIDGVVEKYSNHEFTLEELKNMSKWDILNMEIICY